MAACDVARVARASLACAGPRSRASQQFDGATRRFASRPASASRATGALRRVHRARPYRGGAACSSAADDDGGEGEGAKRDAAAAAGMLAPLDVCTLVGAELDDIMKTDPVAFERALTDKVRAPLRPQSIPDVLPPRFASFFLGVIISREKITTGNSTKGSYVIMYIP